ncbi:hypothetical protein CsSME_00037397 [Camellia sinensis var. sinensis]
MAYNRTVHGPGADIDILCVGPRHATRDEDFFGELYNMLAEIPEIQELHPVPDAHVPILKFKFSGVSIDLLYANVALGAIPEVTVTSVKVQLFLYSDKYTCIHVDCILGIFPSKPLNTLYRTNRAVKLSYYAEMYEILGKETWGLFKCEEVIFMLNVSLL